MPHKNQTQIVNLKKIMRKVKILIAVAIMLLSSSFLVAQSENNVKNLNYDRRYRFDIELACSVPTIWEFSSSHGYCFGNGLYVGGGAGFYAEFLPDYKTIPTYYIPVFADVKYNITNTLVSPFISLRGGVDFDVCRTGMNINLNPAVGLDISRFFINFGYDTHLGVWRHSKGTNSHYFKIGIGVTL